MTIIIGIICKDSIVLASDSQTTRDGRKRTDAKKITCVKFGEHRVLVGQAGHADNADRAIEILKEMAKAAPVSDYRMPAEMARDAMVSVKRELQKQFCDCTAIELQDLIASREQQCELMLAYYFRGKPYLYTVDLTVARCDKVASWCSAIGCGASLGGYLLSEHTKRDMNRDLCASLAGYIVETVCKHDVYCSPPVQVGIILNDLGESSRLQNPDKEVHPETYGMGLVMISKAKQIAARHLKEIEKIMSSEKERRNKAIARLIVRETEEGSRMWKEFFINKTPKSAQQIAKFVSEAGVSTFDVFKST